MSRDWFLKKYLKKISSNNIRIKHMNIAHLIPKFFILRLFNFLGETGLCWPHLEPPLHVEVELAVDADEDGAGQHEQEQRQEQRLDEALAGEWADIVVEAGVPGWRCTGYFVRACMCTENTTVIPDTYLNIHTKVLKTCTD